MIDDFYIECTRKRPTNTLNENNRAIKSYVDTTINGYVGTRSIKNVLIAGQWTVKTQYKFYTSDWEIEFGDLIDYENLIYKVVSHPKNTAHKDNHMKVMLEEIDNIKQ